MHRLALLLLAALSLATSGPALAALGSIDGVLREPITVPFPVQGGKPLSLEAIVTRPAAPGRHPLVVLSHGAPRDTKELPNTSPGRYSAAAISFARRGWVVVNLVRRGYGRSEGSMVEGSGRCSQPDYVGSGRTSAQDVLAAVRHMSGQPYVDPGRVMLVGLSAGGFASLAAAAEKPAGLLGVVNFAGGRGSTAPDQVCNPEALVEAFGRFGRTIAVPTLFLYAQNDHFFGPNLARRFFAAYREAGAAGEFVQLPAFGEDGHLLFRESALPLWQEPLDRFLRAHKLPTWSHPSDIRLPAIPPHQSWGASGLKEFDRYRGTLSFEKALAVAPNGRFVWNSGFRTAEDASQSVLARCEQENGRCRLYAVNNRLAR